MLSVSEAARPNVSSDSSLRLRVTNMTNTVAKRDRLPPGRYLARPSHPHSPAWSPVIRWVAGGEPDAGGVWARCAAGGLILAAVVNGAALEVQSLIWTNTLQEVVPSERLGRVASIDQLGSYVLLPIGFAITGWATTLLGPATVFVLGGGITACLALVALEHPAVRRFD